MGENNGNIYFVSCGKLSRRTARDVPRREVFLEKRLAVVAELTRVNHEPRELTKNCVFLRTAVLSWVKMQLVRAHVRISAHARTHGSGARF